MQPDRPFAAVLILGALGCSPEPTLSPTSNVEICSSEERLLLQPQGDSEALLGLAVTEGADGQLVIAEERAPDCSVMHKRRVVSQWDRSCVEDSGRVAVFSLGYSLLAGLRTEYKSELRVERSVSNSTELRADLEGQCGERVVVGVLEGTGHRSVQFFSEGGGFMDVGAGPLNARGGGSGWQNTKEIFDWSRPQAWGIRLGPGNSQRKFIRIQMPATITSGHRVAPTIQVHKAMWLIVLYRDANGNFGILLPTPDIPTYRAPSGDAVKLPEIVFSTLPGHAQDEETLIVYGFLEEPDYTRFAPDSGNLSQARVNQYAADLQTRLDNREIPPTRWSSAKFHYTVVAGKEK